jgi:cytochrome c-type biogenesis protein CcmH
MRAAAAALACALALVLTLATAAAAVAAALLPDIEDEVMCVQCGTPLNLSTAAVADDQRAFIRQLIAEGRSKEEIKAALVAEFGPSVLAMPPESGFALSAYLVPIVLAAFGLAGVVVAARRWRRRRGGGGPDDDEPPAQEDPLPAEEARRLERELAAFDA